MKITVVNMIPKSMSGETNQDSEPNLAVNPNNPLQIAATAFTPNPTGGAFAPIFISGSPPFSWKNWMQSGNPLWGREFKEAWEL